ncbi:FKBP-type peptidyl-prolyl cis-trans isomerase [Pedobacter xixiisoli]|uniref:Peptidyl-prolyl cis-trans isomerase n=2 Tax=Pedobacter xixiisoli TaxID=1476464 RepID=A0A286A7N9_9SPHI|nr:FKBP-type peptidyl-prolyl cis-trans isomerase [Pedobacter xixiisoli]SOD17924.1 FKBP-type peptidyl-prolyl cis-trans isomerase [Pedobacter xixiisoli]
MRKITTYIVALFSVLVIFSSCKKEYESIESIDEAKIKDYIAKNNLQNVEPDGTGAYYKVVEQGAGTVENFKNTDLVFYNITVKSLLSGTQYLESPTYTNLSNYVGYLNSFYNSSLSSTSYNIPTIRTAVLALKPGGTVRVILPSHLAFGKNGAGTIPSNEIIDLYIKTSTYKTQAELDDNRIITFLAANNITNAVKHSSGVYYQELTPGTGTEVIDEHSTLVVKYAGKLLDGTQFDAGDSFSTKLTDVIEGWGKVLPLFKQGAKVRIFIPSGLGYGVSGSGPIPPNAVLDFTIDITTVTNN